MSASESLVWVFGYGSLVWKVGFEFEQRLVGYIGGYKRRFWWWSLDHRGVPGAPGLVVTLVPTGREADRVWGVAYGVRRDVWEDRVRSHLDHREKGGYSRKEVIFHPKDTKKESHEVSKLNFLPFAYSYVRIIMNLN